MSGFKKFRKKRRKKKTPLHDPFEFSLGKKTKKELKMEKKKKKKPFSFMNGKKSEVERRIEKKEKERRKRKKKEKKKEKKRLKKRKREESRRQLEYTGEGEEFYVKPKLPSLRPHKKRKIDNVYQGSQDSSKSEFDFDVDSQNEEEKKSLKKDSKVDLKKKESFSHEIVEDSGIVRPPSPKSSPFSASNLVGGRKSFKTFQWEQMDWLQ